MGTVKQRNFRLDDETVEKFSQICDEMGLTQSQGFAHIIEIVELERAKGVLTNRETEIEDFQQKVKSLVSSYIYSLELNENAEARIKDSFISLLDSKDAIILDHQEKNIRLNEKINELENALEQQEMIRDDLEAVAADLMNLQERYNNDIEEKNRLNELLSDKVKSLSNSLEEYKELKNDFYLLQKENEDYKISIRDMETSYKEHIRSLQQELKDLKNDNERTVERISMDLEKKHSYELRELDRKHNDVVMKFMLQIQELQDEKNQYILELTKFKAASGNKLNK